jgi:tetratricopeptide (TPR) repeat protein
MRPVEALPYIKWAFSRVGLAYAIVVILVFSLVDIKAVVSRYKVRQLNDARPAMGMLASFSAGQKPGSSINWPAYIRYFELVLRYMPTEAVSEMFLGLCKYYAGDRSDRTWEHIRHSADVHPFIFWNVYNAGVLAFERGDMPAAILHFERLPLFPSEKAEAAIRSAVVYRQVIAMQDQGLPIRARIDTARENAQLLLAAAYFYTGAFEKAKTAALLLAEKVAPKDKEPFYFYAGAADIKLGRIEEAMSLFGRCVELGSRNPEVYRYAGEVLKRTGSQDAGENMLRTGKALQQRTTGAFPYPERLRLQFI